MADAAAAALPSSLPADMPSILETGAAPQQNGAQSSWQQWQHLSFQSLSDGSPDLAVVAMTSSGDLRHTSSGDTSLRPASASQGNIGDDADMPLKVGCHSSCRYQDALSAQAASATLGMTSSILDSAAATLVA